MSEQEKLLQEINEREKQRDEKDAAEQKGIQQIFCCWAPGCFFAFVFGGGALLYLSSLFTGR